MFHNIGKFVHLLTPQLLLRRNISCSPTLTSAERKNTTSTSQFALQSYSTPIIILTNANEAGRSPVRTSGSARSAAYRPFADFTVPSLAVGKTESSTTYRLV